MWRVLALIPLAACGGAPTATTPGSPVDTGPPPSSPPSTTSSTTTTTPPAGPPSFRDDVVPVFYRSCGAGDNTCHSRVAFHPQAPECLGWLSLEDAALGSINPTNGEPTGCPDLELHERLLQMPSWACVVDGMEVPYVDPGDLEASYLWQKVLADGLHCYGTEQMPPDVDLPDEDRAILRAWILAGAPVP